MSLNLAHLLMLKFLQLLFIDLTIIKFETEIVILTHNRKESKSWYSHKTIFPACLG